MPLVSISRKCIYKCVRACVYGWEGLPVEKEKVEKQRKRKLIEEEPSFYFCSWGSPGHTSAPTVPCIRELS